MDNDQTVRPFVQCCSCTRVVPLSEGAAAGDIITCPFCSAKQRLREMIVLVSDPVVEA